MGRVGIPRTPPPFPDKRLSLALLPLPCAPPHRLWAPHPSPSRSSPSDPSRPSLQEHTAILPPIAQLLTTLTTLSDAHDRYIQTPLFRSPCPPWYKPHSLPSCHPPPSSLLTPSRCFSCPCSSLLPAHSSLLIAHEPLHLAMMPSSHPRPRGSNMRKYCSRTSSE